MLLHSTREESPGATDLPPPPAFRVRKHHCHERAWPGMEQHIRRKAWRGSHCVLGPPLADRRDHQRQGPPGWTWVTSWRFTKTPRSCQSAAATAPTRQPMPSSQSSPFRQASISQNSPTVKPTCGLMTIRNTPECGDNAKPSKGIQSMLAFNRQWRTGGEIRNAARASGLAPKPMHRPTEGQQAHHDQNGVPNVLWQQSYRGERHKCSNTPSSGCNKFHRDPW